VGEILQAPGLAAALATLPNGRWVALHGLDWPTPLMTPADVVAIGPGGVFVVVVVDTRKQPATVLLDAPWVGGEFRGDLVERAEEAAAAVLGLVPGVDPAHVWPVLCFDQGPMLLEHCDEVTVCSSANLVSLLTSRFPVLNTRQVHTIHARLRAGMRRAAAGLRHVPPQPAAPVLPPPHTRGRLIGGTVLALAVLIGAGIAMANLPAIGHAARSLVAGTAPLGRTMDVAGRGGELRVTVRAVHPAGERAGKRLFAVELVVVDLDDKPWTGSPARSVWLVDADGARFRAAATTRGGGAVLPRRATVRPGHPVHGRVLVAVPRHAEPTVVEFRLGDGRHGSAEWQLR
jgi:hypothetical protein